MNSTFNSGLSNLLSDDPRILVKPELAGWLTRAGKSHYLKEVKRLIIGAAFLCFCLISPGRTQEESPPQEIPVQKPKYDYLSTFLSRSTRPLGFKEDQEMRKLIRQPASKWAARAGVRHILH